MKTRMSCYESLLFTLLCFNYATRKSLMLLNFSDIAIYMSIKRGIEEKTISESSIRYRRVKGERKHSLTYLTITVAGIKYLEQNCGQHIPWLKYLPNDLSHIRIRGVRCAMSQVERFMRMSIAGQAASAIGAQVEPLYLTTGIGPGKKAPDGMSISEMNAMEDDGDAWWLSEDLDIEDSIEPDTCEAEEDNGNLEDGADALLEREPTLLLSDVVRNAMMQAGAENRYPKEKNTIVFHSSREVKTSLNAVIKSGNSTLASRDLMICRYSGLLESCLTSLLVYVPSASGMDWRERIVRKELATQAAFSKLYSTYGPIEYSNQNAVILVQNEKMLEDIYFDRHGRREENEVLGRAFNHFYVIALEKSWMADLKRLLTRDLAESQQKFLHAAVSSQLYEWNDRISAELFPVRTVGEVPLADGTVERDVLVADGTLMDLNKLNAIRSICQHIGNLKCGIFCKSYQLKYYQRIMPYVYYMVVD